MKKIIIFGGTTLARDVLQKTMAHSTDVFCFYSLKNIAGQKFLPTIPDPSRGKIISGGFAQYDAGHNGADDSTNNSARGLARFCQQEKIAALVLAVSPFASVMMATATRVARELSLPIFYLQPAPWQIDNEIKNKKILLAQDINQLCELFLQHQPPAKNIFVALGGKDGAAFLSRVADNRSEQAAKKPSILSSPIIFWRAIYQPPVDSTWQEKLSLKIILSPPQDVAREKNFLQENNIDLLVAKNSGGEHSNNKNKIIAALACHVPILLLSPPSNDISPQGIKGAEGATNDKNHFTKVDDLLEAFNRIIK
ncbi:MAG: precorrin-6A/cobalt-precorrin-6A reductase [Hydrotalea sp.]|nr:precorrin-6A/cobalt-precorrin-6A reductase [Hydrotalea sp.]